MRQSFILPSINKLLENREHLSDKIVVVSILGKSAYNAFGVKLQCLGRTFANTTSSGKTNGECSIECCYDEENQVMYLHLKSLLDSSEFVQHYEDLAEKIKTTRESDDFLTVYDEIKSSFARALLLLFCVSHIVILSHPSHTFDISYIQYFKAAESLRQKFANSCSEALKNVEGLDDEWISHSRFCTPRMLFFFERSPKNIRNIKKLEHNIEDRIYHVLKKTRIISSSSSSLFAIPMNEEFVFISDKGLPDRLGQAVRSLIQGCQLKGMMHLEAPFSTETSSPRSFVKFLQGHIQQARGKGFDDNVSSANRHPSQHSNYFEIPSLQHWATACSALYDTIMQPDLVKSLCTDTSFSEQRCLKVLPLALARYQEGLPSHYTHATHETRLASALTLFGVQARGPVFQKYCEQLESECLAYWEAGRQLCEAASLTGNPCTLPKHSADQEHCSGVRYIAACDCGRKQGSREDPYTAKQANCTFYTLLSKDCACSTLDRITFPVFQPSIKEYTAATLTECDEPLSVLSDRSAELTPDLERSLARQPSTTEYLPGMLTLSAPPGLLPQFASWSLVCLGASSLYSHNIGLSDAVYPGFLAGTNYLLPWDVTVYAKTAKGGWPQMGKQHAARGRRPRPTNSLPQFTVKVFVGVEYECPRGHRFMLAGPDKVLRPSPNSMVKDTGHKIAESDMPLYFPCPCRAAKPLTAQLMRLHVVTPKAPVHCTLNPKVQPAASAPIFVSSGDGPVSLTQSAYWVMRLPYIYATDKEHFPENHAAKLLQGVFGVVSEND